MYYKRHFNNNNNNNTCKEFLFITLSPSKPTSRGPPLEDISAPFWPLCGRCLLRGILLDKLDLSARKLKNTTLYSVDENIFIH